MWMASVYNYDRDDDFVVFAETKQKAIDDIVRAYSNWYGMNDNDAENEGYDTMEEYITEQKELRVIEIKTGVFSLNREWRDIESGNWIKEGN